jgi:hypothetical protein|uniref:Uncharacterized protein n=1 Tax=viral metagenome TaxID=1070528 RepID=A0A6C0HCC4_9ZZZZ
MNNSSNTNNSSNNSNSNNFAFYSLHNVENYKSSLNYSISEILNKHNLLIVEYLKFITEKVSLKNVACNKFIIIRGLETVSHVFNNILYYTKNIDLAFYHGQKAFYFYVEFIEQISDDQHTFLQLNSRDAAMFVYKKTIFDINNEYRKNMDAAMNNKNYSDYFDILQLYSTIIKLIISFLIHKSVFNRNNGKICIDIILNQSKTIFEKVCYSKYNKNEFHILLTFVEQLTKDIEHDKYIKILELFLKKFQRGRIIELKITEKIYNQEFREKLEDTPEKFISWLFI